MKRLENQDTTNLKLFNLPLLKNSEVVEKVRKWIDALRSGDYIQERTALNYTSTDGSCKYLLLGNLTQKGNTLFSMLTELI